MRMPFGDHLEELRRRLILALVGLVGGTLLSLAWTKPVMMVVCAPLQVALFRNGLRPGVMAFGVADGFVIYLKTALLSGLVLSMPWVFYQVWLFIAAGLYSNERRFVRLFAPASMGLFALGVLFLYFVALPIGLNFFIRFNKSFGTPGIEDSSFHRWLLGGQAPEDGEASPEAPGQVPILRKDPQDPPVGAIWVNERTRRLMVRMPEGTASTALEEGAAPSAIDSLIGLREYVSFVLELALAFGVAFQLPIAVVFLAITGIVPAGRLAQMRKYVIFGIVIAAAILTPPDVISQLLLAVPMIALFELGILVGRWIERRYPPEASERWDGGVDEPADASTEATA